MADGHAPKAANLAAGILFLRGEERRLQGIIASKLPSQEVRAKARFALTKIREELEPYLRERIGPNKPTEEVLAMASSDRDIANSRQNRPSMDGGSVVMKISARNVLLGTVNGIMKGAVNAEIVLSLLGGETIVAVITNASVDRLGLKPGMDAFAVINSSDLMVGKGLENARLSARNVFAGKVAELQEGAVNSEVGVWLPGGTKLICSITKESVQALDLKQDDQVSAVVKASHVLIGI